MSSCSPKQQSHTSPPLTLSLSFLSSFSVLVQSTHINVRNIYIHACSIKQCCNLLYIGEDFISLFNLCLILFAHLSKYNMFKLNPSCYICHKPGDNLWMRKGPDCDYDKRNMSVVICDKILSSGQPGQDGDRNTFEVMASTRNPWFNRFFVSSNPLLGNRDRNHKDWNIGSIEWYLLHVQVLLECCHI